MIVSAEKSYPKECEFRNNSCNGAAEVFVDIATIPLQVKEMALEASAALGLVWSRADIVVDRETEIPYLMEVNRCPGISSGTSEVLGAREFLETHLGLPRVETKEEIIQPITEIVEEVVEIVKAK
jgi:glutathione synthase/RimK-type ligase-like ATP-grasp enzyme